MVRWHPEALACGKAGQMRMGDSLWQGRNFFVSLIWMHISPHWRSPHGGVESRSPPLMHLAMFRVFPHYWFVKLRALAR